MLKMSQVLDLLQFWLCKAEEDEERVKDVGNMTTAKKTHRSHLTTAEPLGVLVLAKQKKMKKGGNGKTRRRRRNAERFNDCSE